MPRSLRSLARVPLLFRSDRPFKRRSVQQLRNLNTRPSDFLPRGDKGIGFGDQHLSQHSAGALTSPQDDMGRFAGLGSNQAMGNGAFVVVGAMPTPVMAGPQIAKEMRGKWCDTNERKLVDRV